MTKSICSKRSIEVLFLLLLSGMSQAEPVWLLVDEVANESELSSAVKPTDAITPLAIEITLATLATLDRDSEVVLSIGGGVELNFVIVNVINYPNGDIGWSAAEESNGYLQTFSITAGANDLVASLMTGDKSYEVVAKRQAHRDSYIGWLYQEVYKTPKPLNEVSIAPPASDRVYSFLTEPGLSVVMSADLVDRYYTIIGQGLVWTFTLNNTIDRVTKALTLSVGGSYADTASEYYYRSAFNDNSEFFDLPDNCVEKTYLDTDPFRKIDEISCEIDPMAAQSSQTLTLKSRMKPGLTLDKLLSGALSVPFTSLTEKETYIAGYGSYSGYFSGPIPVVDVLTDSDADGLSDYNEGLLGSDPLDASSDASRDVVIDIAVLYTSNFVEQVAINPETKINSAMTIVNEIFSGSNTGIQFNIVHYEPLDYINNCTADRCEAGQSWNDTQTVLAEYGAQNEKNWRFSEKIRSLKGADYVLIMDGDGGLDPTAGQAVSGTHNRGYFGFKKHRRTVFVHYTNYGYDTDEQTIAHELGHMLGSSHSRKQSQDVFGLDSGTAGTFPWATGHAVEDKFVTIMPYREEFGIASQISRFSDASRSDCDYSDPINFINVVNVPCGIEITDTENGADVVAAMKIVRYQHEMFSPPRPALPTRASDGKNYSSKFLASAIKDIEVGFVSNFLSSEKINIEGTIRISSEHAGKIGTTHIILDAGALGAFQLNDSNVFVPFNMASPVLVGAIEPRPLKSIENLLVFDDLVPEAMGIDSLLLNIYFGYSLFNTELVVYSGAPLTVQIEQP